ncbi:MAG: ankyrin repeat domain-containing protein, partial [Planctomycetaceae bacterium]|nr:ankyrin repeat domain-containing protein [Planctomycetaceae bacterium]
MATASAPAREPATTVVDAAEQRDTSQLQSLLAQHADVNLQQPDGMTALHWAVYHDDAELARSLMEAGAQVTAVTRYGVSPLSLACTNGNAEIVSMLLNAGADPRTMQPGGETVLMTAARTGRLGPVQLLLEKGADVNATERKGQTALMWAAADGHVDVVEALLKAGADAHARLPSGFSSLFFAAREGKSDVIRRLIAAGADVNEPLDPDRPTDSKTRDTSALLLAVESGHFETALVLLDLGADPNGRPGGYTALHALTWVRQPIRGDGDPPPIGSGKTTSLEFVRELVARGADVNSRLERGESARGRFTTTGSTP